MIAKALKMSKANLYHYCNSKEDLLFKVHLDYIEKRFIPIIEQAEQATDPKDRITLMLKQLTLMVTTDRATKVLIQDIANLNRSHHTDIISIWRRAYNVVNNSIDELQKSGKAVKFRGSFQTLLGFGMVFWISFWFDYSRQVNAEELAETVVQTFLNGLLHRANEKH
jgi:AcrR family transcriptional regulator